MARFGVFDSVVSIEEGDDSSPTVQEASEDLRSIPEDVGLPLIGAGVTIHVGERPARDLTRARALPPPIRRRIGAAAAYWVETRTILIGDGDSTSASKTLHEVGHALGHLFHLHEGPDMEAAWWEATRIETLDDYYGARVGYEGSLAVAMRETFAEAFALFFVSGRETVVRTFGGAMDDYLVREIRRRMEP